jgi:hypothetical protein
MTRYDHDRLDRRDRVRHRGFEDINGKLPTGLSWAFWRAARTLPKHPPLPDKATLRAQADDAWRSWRAMAVSTSS